MAAAPPAIPITVRQLEAIVRISESLAKMRLLDEVHDEHVREAIRIFQVSTLAASKSGMIGESMGFVDSQTLEEITCVPFSLCFYVAPSSCMFRA